MYIHACMHTNTRTRCSACHGAIRFGDSLSMMQCRDIIRQLSKCKVRASPAHPARSLVCFVALETLSHSPPLACSFPSSVPMEGRLLHPWSTLGASWRRKVQRFPRSFPLLVVHFSALWFADSPQPRFLCCSSYIVQRRRLIRLGGSLARSCACSFSSRSRGRRPGPRDVQRGRFGYTPLLCLSVCLALSLSLSLFPVSGFCLLFAMLL